MTLLPLFFSIESGQVYTRSDSPLRAILYHILNQISTVHDCLHLFATQTTKTYIVDAIFDTDVLPLVNGDIPRAVEMLGPQEKARLLAQGISSCIAFATHLSSLRVDVTADVLRNELCRFSSSKQPSHIRHTMEQSHLFSSCLMMDQIMDLIIDASHEVSIDVQPKCASFQDYEVDAFSSGYERPSRNMGLPWGFAFLVLN